MNLDISYWTLAFILVAVVLVGIGYILGASAEHRDDDP